MIQNSDFRKFDGTFKTIMAGNSPQRLALESFLQKMHQQKKLVYGLHLSDSALLTYLVFEGAFQAVHFIDGNDGGYCLAAKNPKQQLAEFDF